MRLCCFQGISPPLRTWPRNSLTVEGVACWLVPAMLCLGLELGNHRQGRSALTLVVHVPVMTRGPFGICSWVPGATWTGAGALYVYIFSICRQRGHYKHIHHSFSSPPCGKLCLQTMIGRHLFFSLEWGPRPQPCLLCVPGTA